MTKKTIFFSLVALLCGFGVGPRLCGQPLLRAEDASDIADTARLRSQLEYLTDNVCGGRATGTKEMSRSTFWLSRRFRDIGLTPIGGHFVHHFYTASGPIGRNVIGMIPGSKGYSTDYTLVLAHYDGLGNIDGVHYPGADSNASGVVALLSLAEMFTAARKCGARHEENLIFVATDGKGLRMTGAENLFYLLHDLYLRDPFNRLTITLDRVSLVVNLDQLGSSLSPLSRFRPDYLIMLGDRSLPEDRQGLLEACNDRYGTGLHLGHDYYGSDNFTRTFYTRIGEQKFFVEEHIPSVLFTSGITLNNNKSCDSVGSLNLAVMKRRIVLIFRWLEMMVAGGRS